MNPIALTITQLTKSFQPGQPAVSGLDLEVRRAEILALLGPSGCGKTTILRLIAGFERPEQGAILLNQRQIVAQDTFIPPEQRGVGLVFQEYALFPHLTAAQNVAFGLQHLPKDQVQAAVAEMLALVGLADLAGRYPHELSGGQRQRIALARALAPRPALLLLDEPFSNLDADLRVQMRIELRAILKELHTTAILVTHDQEEAMYFGDRVAIINQGRLEQVGPAEQIFHQPATRFVADFMGDTHFLPGTVNGQGIQTELGALHQAVDLPAGTPVEIALRPDDLDFTPDPAGSALVATRYFRGTHNLYLLDLPSGQKVPALKPHIEMFTPGQRVTVYLNPGHDLAIFPLSQS